MNLNIKILSYHAILRAKSMNKTSYTLYICNMKNTFTLPVAQISSIIMVAHFCQIFYLELLDIN